MNHFSKENGGRATAVSLENAMPEPGEELWENAVRLKSRY